MKLRLLFVLTLTSFALALSAAPSPTPSPKRIANTSEKTFSAAELAQSANGWTYNKGEWVHPEGYKYVNGKILRTTARPGKPLPNAPGKLALANAEALTSAPKTVPAPNSPAKAATDKSAERKRNLAPRAAPQTGSHM